MYKKLLIILGIALACINCSHILRVDYNTPIDFRNVYLGAKLWRQHANPYVDSTLKQEWYAICKNENISPNYPPGLPNNFLVYPPNALLLYVPLSVFTWKQAVWVNAVLMMVSLVIIVWMTYQLFAKKSTVQLWVIVLAIFSFKGTMHAIIVGQPSFLANALALSGLYFSLNKNQPITASLFLALAAFKPTMLLPYIVFIIYKKNWKTLIYTSLLATLFAALSFTLYPQPIDLLQAALHNIKAVKELIFASKSTYFLETGTEIGILFSLLIAKGYTYHIYIYALIGIAFIYFLYKNRQKDDAYIFSLCMLFALLVSHHLFYDALFLLPVSWVIFNYPTTVKTILLILAIPLFVPINGIIQKLQLNEWLNFLAYSLPVSLLAIAIVLLLNKPQHSSLPEE